MMRAKYKGVLTGLSSGMSWGLNAVLISLVMGLTPFVDHPLLLFSGIFICCMLHDLFAAIVMSFYMVSSGKMKDILRSIGSKDAIYCIVAALFGGPMAMSFYTMAIDRSGAALTAVITSCYPLLGSVLAVVLLREHIRTKSWLGLMICVLGVAYIGVVSSSGDAMNEGGSIGILFAFGAALGWAAEGIVSAWGMKSDDISPETALFIREWVSVVVYALLVCPIFVGGYGRVIATIEIVLTNYQTIFYLLGAASVGVFSFLMWYRSIYYIGASSALCLNVTYSFWSIFFSMILMNGSFSMEIAIGATLVVVGVCYYVMSNR